MATEEWRAIAGFDRYEVSSLGGVRRKLKGEDRYRVLHPHPTRKGYLVVQLYRLGRKKKAKVHRLVAIAFIGIPFPGQQTNHIDCDKKNNRVSNLQWCTSKQNSDHAVAHGLYPHGENHHLSVLSDDDVELIRSEYAQGGCTHLQLADKFGVVKSTISKIMQGRSRNSASARADGVFQ